MLMYTIWVYLFAHLFAYWHTKKVFFVLYAHTLQCRVVAKARRFGPVNQTKTDGCLTGLLTGPKRRALAVFWSCQPDKRLTPGQQTRQTPVSLCLVDRTKTPRFGHSSTLQGPLHGIPYGLKDIIAVPEYKTTWGSTTFKDQVLDIEAWVYKRLKSAGAVLVGKLVTGSLAYDDIWFGGRTRNPWNIEEFTTGSSAGPAACTSAGMVPFAIGSETAGSITYPSARCGVTALRPTFGAVGRTGVLSLSESLDKLGPLCRSAVDCAIVLDVIRGKDPDDLSSRKIFLDDPFSVDITKLTVGYIEDAEMEVVDVLRTKGVKMVPFKLNYTVESVQGILNFTMDVDMLAHFDTWQRSGQDDEFEAQDQWPTELRRARVIPAVDYIQSQRARGKLIQEVKEGFTVDAFVGNVTDWEKVCVGNLVGMPVMVVPVGFEKIKDPPTNATRRRSTVTTGIYAPPDHDHIALALTMAYQSATDHHKQRPPIDNLGPDDAIPNPPKALIPPRILKG
ncbi:putative amidase [Helianthus annuus]|nr:putative amidase [Helianthus annuus]